MSKVDDDKNEVDHIDRNKSNNRVANLRYVSRSETMMNHGKHMNASSKYKGVSYFRRDRKWQSQIRIDGKTHHLGYFNLEAEAANAYNTKARELSEFYVLNILPCEESHHQSETPPETTAQPESLESDLLIERISIT